MGNTSSVSFIGQSCRPKSSPRIPTRPYTVRSKTCHSVLGRYSPLTSLLIGSSICKAVSAIWFHQNLLLQLHQNPVWFCPDSEVNWCHLMGFFCVFQSKCDRHCFGTTVCPCVGWNVCAHVPALVMAWWKFEIVGFPKHTCYRWM